MDTVRIVTAEQEIADLRPTGPHVVILGAGASYAACPNGDANGRRLPLMKDFIELLRLGPILDKTDLVYRCRNFEDVYSELFARPEYNHVREELERAVCEYFRTLRLPSTPNLYDHLVLSLREKDVIATFNWDPFLVQAFRRNSKRCRRRLPRLLFLHGNVMVGYCETDKVMVLNGNHCGQCGNLVDPSRLLFPIAEKNYEKDAFVAEQWQELAADMRAAFMVTLFGYGAPATDAAAIDLLKGAWGDPANRTLEEIEIINILPEEELVGTWKPFIYSHHYHVRDDFYSSWLANHPRRTGEAYINLNLEAMLIYSNPIPRKASFDELWGWFDELLEVELEEPQDTA